MEVFNSIKKNSQVVNFFTAKYERSSQVQDFGFWYLKLISKQPVDRVRRWVRHVEQEMLTLPEHISSPLVN